MEYNQDLSNPNRELSIQWDIDKLKQVIAHEELDEPVLYGAGTLRNDAVVMEQDGGNWLVYLVDEQHQMIESTRNDFPSERWAVLNVLRKLRQVKRVRDILNSTDPGKDLAHAIADNLDNTFGDVPEWEQLAMILDFNGKRFSGNHGYVYAADGAASPETTRMKVVKDIVDAFIASKHPEDAEYPVAVLVQFDKPSDKYEVTFEYSDPTRWKVSPKNFKEMPEKVRPRFEDTDKPSVS